ncbi:hypothetical protein HC891_20195 [Candidatus Gracilibacteria bacterium]|nr:hypothetical protein [Candidatus Gracilibacteria bacterium]
MGRTNSTDFPVANALQSTAGETTGPIDGFATKLSSSGSSLVYSTYLGASQSDTAYGIAVDAGGNAYITGSFRGKRPEGEPQHLTKTLTPDPISPLTGGYFGAAVIKLTSSGGLVYGTILGSGVGIDITVDNNGRAYVVGSTSGLPKIPVTGFQTAYAGEADVFFAVLNSSGDQLDGGTFLGGASNDYGEAIALGVQGAVYIAGHTHSADFPTSNAFQSEHNSAPDYTDAFVAKIVGDGASSEYSTFLGGSSGNEFVGGLAYANGQAYLAGTVDGFDFPTRNPLDTGGNLDDGLGRSSAMRRWQSPTRCRCRRIGAAARRRCITPMSRGIRARGISGLQWPISQFRHLGRG